MPSKQKAKEQPTEHTTTEQPKQEHVEESKPKPQRIIFVGDGEPKNKVRIGMLTLELPSADEQRKGFETEHARLILSNLHGYKKLISKAPEAAPAE
jgi:histone acetyltransferase (RNA polymerase elongator complex component)